MMTKAVQEVLAERQRQIDVEGWTPEHDEDHKDGSLAVAGACYALNYPGVNIGSVIESLWPWADSWWKPTTRRRDLVKAGALILAELERLDRLGNS